MRPTPEEIEKARVIFASRELPGMGRLLEYLVHRAATGYEIRKIGSAGINSLRKNISEITPMEYLELPAYYLGTVSGERTALEDLVSLSEKFLISDPQLKCLVDQIYADLAETDSTKWQAIVSRSELT